MAITPEIPEVITPSAPSGEVVNPPSGEAVIATVLVPQMGSSDRFLQQGDIDQRKFARLTDEEQVALMHFEYRGRVDGVRYWSGLVDWILNSSPSLDGGKGRREVIELTGAATGAGGTRVAEKPGWVGRHITNRGWKDRAKDRGEIVPGE